MVYISKLSVFLEYVKFPSLKKELQNFTPKDTKNIAMLIMSQLEKFRKNRNQIFQKICKNGRP